MFNVVEIFCVNLISKICKYLVKHDYLINYHIANYMLKFSVDLYIIYNFNNCCF